ncbi:MAG: D-2-hydroxyacid dehydrogenase [Planctomycetia bacterium]|nr:D-2-hydroxyacid dehydrogenase [Planctomycetia bacterium]
MKIVVLDGRGLNPGDLSWDVLRSFGDLEVYDRSNPDQITDRAKGAQIVLTNKTVITEDHFRDLPELRYISLLSTGTNVIDLAAARKYGVDVSNIPSYSTESVVQSTFAHLLNLFSRIAEETSFVKNGEWSAWPDFCHWGGPLRELDGKTLGIIGFGTIGRRVAEVARAFKLNVLVYGPHLPIGLVLDGALAVDLNELYRRSDVISLHCPLGAKNRKMINADRIALMKDGVYLINTARGLLIDDEAVAEALNSGKIAGYGTDVLCEEPPVHSTPLLSAKNCWITPHNAWGTREARLRLMDILAENIRAFIEGKPQNIVN